MGQWIRPAGAGKEMTGDAGGYTGYVKTRDDYTVESKKVRQQNQKFREAANECEGKSQSEFRACMSRQL